MDIFNLDSIFSVSNEPKSKDDFNIWIQQKDVLPFLEKEIKDEDIIIYASLQHTFIHAVLIPNLELDETIVDDLLKWDHSPSSGWGFVVSSDDAWIEGSLERSNSKSLSEG